MDIGNESHLYSGINIIKYYIEIITNKTLKILQLQK